jgi:hypothetical protein
MIPASRASAPPEMPPPPVQGHPSQDAARDLAWRLGLGSTLALGAVLLAWALATDVPRVTNGFFSDGATYYGLAHSLADDFDFEYRREDLVRVWREYPSGPEGVFLKRGRDVHGLSLTSTPPFLRLETSDDWDPNRLYYAKAFIFPLCAAPFVWLFGTNGFLVLHALLMTCCFACAYGFLVARSAPVPSLIFATAFLLVSVVPVYLVQFMPDFFNLALVLIGYFFWCYKEAVTESTTCRIGRWRERWLMGARSDVIAAALLGIAVFSKPTLVLIIVAPLLLHILRRQWRRAVVTALVFGTVVLGLFAANVAITGDWNYQGGDRKTFYSTMGTPLPGFPYQTDRQRFDTTGIPKTTNRVPVEVLTGRAAFFDVFRRNLGYFVFGRHTGLVPYFLPGVIAVVLFLFTRAFRRRPWQWLTFGAAVASALLLILYMPFTYSGGGGPVGNRYFLGAYPLLLFVTPPLARMTSAIVATALSAAFTAPLVSNPFYSSFHPAEHAKTGLYRMLPVELTLLNDLPINVIPSRIKQPLGGSPPLQGYFLDDNAYGREGDRFWVRGASRADIMLRAPVVTEVRGDQEVVRPLQLPRLEVLLETGPVANRVTIKTGAETQVIDIAANDHQAVTIRMAAGLPYKAFPELPTNYVYLLSIATKAGFVPMFQGLSGDSRFLGVYVRLTPIYE